MYLMIALEDQIEKSIQDCKRLLRDMDYYGEVPSSTYLQSYMDQKMRQLNGLKLMLQEDRGESNISEAKTVYQSIKDELFVISKRWKLAVESKFHRQKSKLGKLFYVAPLK